LLDAGAAMLLEQGYHGTGIQPVLDEVGVPKGSFYNYFDSKEHFAAEVIRHMAAKVVVGLDGLKEDARRDALAALRRDLKKRIQGFEGRFSGGCLFGNLGAEVEDSELCRAALADAFRSMSACYATVIAAGQEQGAFRKDVKASELADHLLDTWEGALLRMKVEHSTRPLKALMRRLLDDDFLA
jgi:TetR/AcrR family transcriptional repressor of nem operon